MVRLWQCGSVGMPCLGGSCNCTVGQGGQLQAYRFSELPRGFCRWGVRCEKRELPLPEGCCRDPGLCTDMLASELLALQSSLQKLVVFELESPEKTWLPKKVVPVKWKRGKKKKKGFSTPTNSTMVTRTSEASFPTDLWWEIWVSLE